MPLPYSAPAVLYSPPLGTEPGSGRRRFVRIRRESESWGKKGPFRRRASPPAPPSPRRLQHRIRRWFPWARNGGNAFGIPVSPETADAGAGWEWGERRKNSGSMLDGRILFSPLPIAMRTVASAKTMQGDKKTAASLFFSCCVGVACRQHRYGSFLHKPIQQTEIGWFSKRQCRQSYDNSRMILSG